VLCDNPQRIEAFLKLVHTKQLRRSLHTKYSALPQWFLPTGLADPSFPHLQIHSYGPRHKAMPCGWAFPLTQQIEKRTPSPYYDGKLDAT
jgi:hypothetical protein